MVAAADPDGGQMNGITIFRCPPSLGLSIYSPEYYSGVSAALAHFSTTTHSTLHLLRDPHLLRMILPLPLLKEAHYHIYLAGFLLSLVYSYYHPPLVIHYLIMCHTISIRFLSNEIRLVYKP